MKRFLPLLLGAVLAGVAIAVWAFRPVPNEPFFEGKPVSAWALDLNSPNAEARHKADLVLRHVPPSAASSLARLLRLRDPVLSRPSAFLARRLPERQGSALIRIINPYEARARRIAAAQALRIMGVNAAPAVPALGKALSDDQTVSWHAALALAQLGEPGVQALAQAARSPKPPQAAFACYALGLAGPTASNAVPVLALVLQNGPRDTADTAATALAKIGAPAVPALVAAIAHPDVQVRLRAINGLAATGLLARESIPELTRCTRDEDARIRAAAIHALAQIRPSAPAVIDVLASSLADPVSEVRLKALEGLSRAPDVSKRAAAAVVRLLSDERFRVRLEAALLLCDMGQAPPAVRPILLQALDDNDQVVRARAGAALQKLQPGTASEAGDK